MTHSSGDPSHTDSVIEAIRAGAETRGIEYKSAQPFEAYKWKLVKACMAMANLRDGGTIVIGVAEREAGGYDLTGVSPSEEASYSQDALYSLVNRYARPVVSLLLRFVRYQEKQFVGIETEPFDRIPIICGVPTPQEAGADGLRYGDIVGRSRDRIATSRVGDPELVAEILEVAAEKRAAEIVATAQRIGLRLPDDAQVRFDDERRDFFGER